MTRKTRKSRKLRKNKKIGGVTFRNNTKPNTNTNNFSHLPPTYLNELHNVLFSRIHRSSDYQANNAEVFAALQESYNDPANMLKAINLIYEHDAFTDEERQLLQPYLQTRKVHLAINKIAASTLPESLKRKALMFLRHLRQKHRITKTYITQHPEWQFPANQNFENENGNNSGYESGSH